MVWAAHGAQDTLMFKDTRRMAKKFAHLRLQGRFRSCSTKVGQIVEVTSKVLDPKHERYSLICFDSSPTL